MNQIIFNYDYKENLYNNKKNLIFKNKKNIYFIVFILTLIIIIIIIIYIIYNKYKVYRENLTSKKILNNYNISTLYSNSQDSSNYSAIRLSNSIEIIGLVEIPKINISYPILSKSNEDLLKISVCRFSRTNAKS